MTATVQILNTTLLGVRIELRAIPPLAQRLAADFADLLNADEGTSSPDVVSIDATEFTDPVEVLALLTRTLVEHTPLLCIHAGVVAAPDGLIAFPALSGVGKTTLTAALVRGGFDYVSDEALALDRTSGLASPFPRPLSLAGDVWPLVLPERSDPPPPNYERLVSGSEFGRVARGPGTVRHILLPARRPGGPQLEAVRRGDVVAELLRRCFNHYVDPAASFSTIVALVRGARVWRARYEQAPDLVPLLRDL
jgi:hypothetical protein